MVNGILNIGILILCEKVVMGRLQELLLELTRPPVEANKFSEVNVKVHVFRQ